MSEHVQAVSACGDHSPPALLSLAIAADRNGDRRHARHLMRELAEQFPGWDEPPLRLAESLRREGQFKEAERAYATVLEINPRREEALVAQAALRIQARDGGTAEKLLLRCISINPERAEAWDALGLALLLTNDPIPAESAFAEAQRLAPTVLSYTLHRTEAAHIAGRTEAELARLEQAIDANPVDPVLFTALGLVLERAGCRQQAIDALETACAFAPDANPPATMLGRLLARANRLAEAEAVLRRACDRDPSNLAVSNDYAAVLMRLQRHAAARMRLDSIVAQSADPDVGVLCNLATVLVSLGNQQEGESTARRAIALNPDSPLARRTLANALPYRNGIGGAEMLDALIECGRHLPRAPAPHFGNAPDPARQLKIGLLSGSLRTHPVGWLTLAGFEALNPAQFDIECFAQTTATDAIARRFRARANEWHEIDTLDDLALRRLALDRRIDVLIDLGGYGESGRLAACAHRLAPVQMKWVGMQAHSTGLPEIDWFVSDKWETPPELERFYSERVLRLPDGYVCYSPPPYAPDVAALPAAENGFISFGCFNNLAKITPLVIDTWARILRLIPASILVLKTYQFSETEAVTRVRDAFLRSGITPDRLQLRGASAHRRFMAEYNHIDLVLDPFPYSGGLTTCEALWMGVPTVTLPGETFASRHSTSHLSNVGLQDWIAYDIESYVALAVAKASDLVALATLRAGLRARVKASPLCDAERFGRNLGEALRFAWREWCERQLNSTDALSPHGPVPCLPSVPAAA